ncbi:hypothetical protein DXU77_03770 [Pseudomonas lactis]|nr:hypothetical protein [Pseudomonas lactis]
MPSCSITASISSRLEDVAPGPASSRASPLPHLFLVRHDNSVKCGSGLAREGRDAVFSQTPPFGALGK